MTNKPIFVVDKLMDMRLYSILNIKPIKVQLAQTRGKIYRIHSNPTLFKLNDYSPNKGTQKVIGALLYFADNEIDNVINVLNNYNTCSYSRTLRYNPNDLTYFDEVNVEPIKLKNITELKTFDYETDKSIVANAWFGNVKNKHIQKTLNNRHSKIQICDTNLLLLALQNKSIYEK